jgi:hypothetical protein
MIPIDVIDGNPLTYPLTAIGLIVLIGSAFLAISGAGSWIDPKKIPTLTLIGFTIGAVMMLTGGYIGYSIKKDTVTEWAQERYSIQIPDNEIDPLIEKKIITLDDGTEVQLALPEKDADGYLLYKVTERDELPVK